jgi:ketosteroid isomerase-like protein
MDTSPMSSANLDLLHALFADWERGDFFARAEWAHPKIECEMADGPTPGSGTGLAGLADVFRDVIAPFEDFRVGVEEYREIDDRRVLVLVRFSGRGKTSGLEIGRMGTNNACLLEIDGGSVTRLVLYWDRERLLADLGIAPAGG